MQEYLSKIKLDNPLFCFNEIIGWIYTFISLRSVPLTVPILTDKPFFECTVWLPWLRFRTYRFHSFCSWNGAAIGQKRVKKQFFWNGS